MDKTKSIETGLPHIDQEQAEQSAYWGDPHQSLIKDLHARENIKLIRLIGLGVGGPSLAYVIVQIAQDLLR